MQRRISNNPRPIARVRTPALLSEALNARLASYAVAAAAAGVAAIACVEPALAEPVCKTLSIQLTGTTTFGINPANQVAPPFNVAQSTFSSIPSSGYYQWWWNRGFFVPNSAGAEVLLGNKSFVADVASGAQIGPGGQFGNPKSYGLMFTYGNGSWVYKAHGTLKKHRGNADLTQTNYIGFKFVEAGKIHYGWARLQFRIIKKPYYYPESLTRVLGYGYETTPDTAIAAGSCTASVAAAPTSAAAPANAVPSQVAPPDVTTLGALAAGSRGLGLWKDGHRDNQGKD